MPGRGLGTEGQGRRRNTRSFSSRGPGNMAAHCGRQVMAGIHVFFCAGEIWHTWKGSTSQSHHEGTGVQTPFFPLSSVAYLGKSIRTKDEIRKIQDMVPGKTPLLLFPSSATLCIWPLQPCWINLPFEAILATHYLAKIFLFFLSFEQ